MKRIATIVLITFIVFLGGCSNESQSVNKENTQLKSRISQLEKDLDNKEIETLTINYIENSSSKRFVEKQNDLLALPADNAIKLNYILENTVVVVLDTANANNVTWIYVSIPVYDSPSNYKGWIKETDASLYTKDKVNKVQSDVKVKEGEIDYETDAFENIKSGKPYKVGSGVHGRVQEKKDGYIKILCAGAKTIWIKESSAIYPEVG